MHTPALPVPQTRTVLIPPPGPHIHPSTSTNETTTTSSPNETTTDPKSTATFSTALTLRHTVFVHEQNVPSSNELDADDSRCWHWLLYVRSHSTADKHEHEHEHDSNHEETTTHWKPVGTLRIAPPPHAPEPVELHQLAEPEVYVKLGRLCVLREYRGLGLAGRLVEECLGWVGGQSFGAAGGSRSNHGADVTHADGGGKAGSGVNGGQGAWDGLVLAHAQERLAGLYGMWGFWADEGARVWDEEGMRHLGVWRRVRVRRCG